MYCVANISPGMTPSGGYFIMCDSPPSEGEVASAFIAIVNRWIGVFGREDRLQAREPELDLL